MAKESTKKNTSKSSAAEKASPKGSLLASARKPSKIVSMAKLDESVLRMLMEKYPEGYKDFVNRYPKPNGEFFFAVPLNTPEANYLIKVDVKIDIFSEEDDEKDFFGDVPDQGVEVSDTETEDSSSSDDFDEGYTEE